MPSRTDPGSPSYLSNTKKNPRPAQPTRQTSGRYISCRGASHSVSRACTIVIALWGRGGPHFISHHQSEIPTAVVTVDTPSAVANTFANSQYDTNAISQLAQRCVRAWRTILICAAWSAWARRSGTAMRRRDVGVSARSGHNAKVSRFLTRQIVIPELVCPNGLTQDGLTGLDPSRRIMSGRVVSFLIAHPLQTARRETAGLDEPLDISAKPASRWCLLRGRFSRISDSATRLALISFGAFLLIWAKFSAGWRLEGGPS